MLKEQVVHCNIRLPSRPYHHSPFTNQMEMLTPTRVRLTQFYKPSSEIPAERICVIGGASQNLACILQVFSDPLFTRNVWMVSPTYFLACRIFEDSGFHGRLRSVPEDEDGIDIEYLRKGLHLSEMKARAEGNTQPVGRKNRTTTVILLSSSFLDTQTYTTMEQDLSAPHLCRSHVQQPILSNHES